MDMSEAAKASFLPVYEKLNKAADKSKLMLTTYFESLSDNLSLAVASKCKGLHID
jgi:5-methyltetrahydropteroyltriglutamate--homocysteine methyltransferase